MKKVLCSQKSAFWLNITERIVWPFLTAKKYKYFVIKNHETSSRPKLLRFAWDQNFWEWDWVLFKPIFLRQIPILSNRKGLDREVLRRDLTLGSYCCGCKRCRKYRSCNGFTCHGSTSCTSCCGLSLERRYRASVKSAELSFWEVIPDHFLSFDLWACRTTQKAPRSYLLTFAHNARGPWSILHL